MFLVLPHVSISLSDCPCQLIVLSELEKAVQANNHSFHQELCVFGQYVLEFKNIMVAVALQHGWHHIIELVHVLLFLFCVLQFKFLFSELLVLLFYGL